jgi:hypothetical protein
MHLRKALELIIEALILSLIVALLIASPPILHIFSVKAWNDFLLTFLVTWLVLFLVAVPVARGLHQKREEDDELNRAIDERNKRREEAEEHHRHEERAIKKPLLDGLRAIARGDKVRLGPEALDAAKTLRMRYGEVVAWSLVMDDLSAENVKDANGIKRRLNELLYPDNLEDLEELKKRVSDLEKSGMFFAPETVDAAKEIREYAEIGRLKNEEELAEAKREREIKEAKRTERIKFMEEEIKKTSERLARIRSLKSED